VKTIWKTLSIILLVLMVLPIAITPAAAATPTQPSGDIVALEFSATGALYMSPWNPVLGFNDVYSNLQWNLVHSFGMYNHYQTAIPVEWSATYKVEANYEKDSKGNVIGKISVPDTALVFDPVQNKWIPINQAVAENRTYIPGVEGYSGLGGKVPVKVIFNYDQLYWHHGAQMSIADVMALLAFMYEWSVDDSQVTNQTDPYYDEEYSTATISFLELLKGVEILNDTAIAVYSDYIDVSEPLIAFSLIVYPTIPYELLAAMEQAVVTDPEGTNYGWTDRATTGEVGIDMLKHPAVIKQMAQTLTPDKVYYFNGLNISWNLSDRVSRLVKWIDQRGIAAVSNGPFYVDKFDPKANYLVLKSITNLGFPQILVRGLNDYAPKLNSIEFKTVTTQEAGVEAVKAGQVAVFLWSMPRGKIGDVPPEVKLIPTATVMYMIEVNPVNNVYDPTLPGTIQLRGAQLPGQVIPGLVLYDPKDTLAKYNINVTLDNPNWVPINVLTKEAMADEKFQFNPFGVKEIRQALQVLINRQFIVDNILEGSGFPMMSALRPTHGAYDYLNVADIEEKYGALPAGDLARAKQLFQAGLEKANNTLAKYGMKLVYETGSDGKQWLYLVKPDGTKQQVTIYFVIRIEDERRPMGEQIAAWIEDTFNIKVEKLIRERGVVVPVIYGSNPASYGFKTNPWHLYTAGWVATTDDPPQFARYDVAFYYAPLRGYGPNHRNTAFWYLFDQDAFDLGVQLYFGTYTPDMEKQLYQDIVKMLEWGLDQAFRIGVVNTAEYFMVNTKLVNIPFWGKTTGLWSPWGLVFASLPQPPTTSPPPTTPSPTPSPTPTTTPSPTPSPTPTTTPPPPTTPSPTTSPTPTTTPTGGVGAGTIAAIVVVVIVIAAAAFLLMRKK
jgi:peptide/nickel transport system substrate-binding protein